MKWLTLVLWTYLVFVVQSGFASKLAIAGCSPHLVLAGLIVTILHFSARQAVLVAACWGLISDFLGDGRLGVDVALFALSAMVVQSVVVRKHLSSRVRLVTVTGILVWANVIGSASLRSVADGRGLTFAALCGRAAGSAVYTAALIALVSLSGAIVRRQSLADAVPAAPSVSNRWRMLTG
jgi:rod shape-determining protein MreD